MRSYIQTGREEGATLVAGGNRLDQPGYFVEPTVFVGHNSMTIAREEIFGPVGTVIGFDDVGQAVALANDNVYGLAAVVWTRDLSIAHETARAPRVGAVWINGWGPPDPRLPWGGAKTSGIGRELGLCRPACQHRGEGRLGDPLAPARDAHPMTRNR